MNNSVVVQPASLATALAAFRRAHPTYDTTTGLDTLRTQEYARLDRTGQVYLDYTGGSLYADSQLREHLALLSDSVYGNPHSTNPTSQAMTDAIVAAEAAVLEYANAAPDEYAVIWTPNASGALKLVGEAYPFGPGSAYLLTVDNHNSVNGIREFARARGAPISYVPLRRPDLRIDADALAAALDQAPRERGLFAYPAQSNFSGVQHDLAWIAYAQARGWDVLLDTAAFAPTNRLDLGRWHPDFVTLSFYKLFGYPTGVGCLLARKSALARLRRPWFAGGTIAFASVVADGHRLAPGAAAFEDGTLNYLSLPAVAIGLRHLAAVGIDTLHARVTCLTGWLLQQLAALRHADGRPVVQILGPTDTTARGATIAINLYDGAGQLIDVRVVEALANQRGISLRTGCFCNPGANEAAHGLTRADLAPLLAYKGQLTVADIHSMLRGKPFGAVRVSLGIASNFADVYRCLEFAASFRDKLAADMLAGAEHRAAVPA